MSANIKLKSSKVPCAVDMNTVCSFESAGALRSAAGCVQLLQILAQVFSSLQFAFIPLIVLELHKRRMPSVPTTTVQPLLQLTIKPFGHIQNISLYSNVRHRQIYTPSTPISVLVYPKTLNVDLSLKRCS